MNELSLFSGAGGGILGSKLLGWRTIGYVEYERYCQQVLRQRISDGILDAAPIFGDIRKFVSEGYAELYHGMVDVLTGGFPCQPFSVAGKGLGEADPRNMWPATVEVLRIVRPRYALFENVPGLLQKTYFRTILREIAESGYDCRWGVLGASDVGANHRRKRLWILAYTPSGGEALGRERGNLVEETGGREGVHAAALLSGEDAELADPGKQELPWPTRSGEQILRAKEETSTRSESCRGIAAQRGSGKALADADEPRLQNRRQAGEPQGKERNTEAHASTQRRRGSWWSTEPALGRVAHGVAHRVDRLKAIGNGQVPLCMARAFQVLSEGII